MQFKTKDLLVTVLPKSETAGAQLEKHCLLRTIVCLHPSFCMRASLDCGHCSLLFTNPCFHATIGCRLSWCPGGSACDPTYICPGASGDPFVIQDLEGLASLKTELQATLKSLEVMQKEGLPTSITSQTGAEALERGLTEALEQVRLAKSSF